MRALVLAAAVALAVALAAPAVAAPYRPDAAASADPAWKLGVAAWRAAEAEPSPRAAVPRWEAAARAFEALPTAEAALAAAIAWDHAIRGTPHAAALDRDGPVTAEDLDDHEHHVVDDVARFFARAGAQPIEAQVVAARFARAHTLWQRGHDDEADPDLEALVAHHPGTDAAPFAATMLLDSLNRRQRYDDLQRWAELMSASPALLHQDADLATNLVQLRRAFAVRAAETAERDHAYARCGELYDRVYAFDPKDARADEALYNAAVCFEASGDARAALARDRDLLRIAPSSRLATRVLAGMARLDLALADFAAAASDNERLAWRADVVRERRDAFDNALTLRAALGDDAIVDNDLAAAARLMPGDAAHWADRGFALAHHRLDRGDRARARRALDGALARAHDPQPLLPGIAWELACPVPLEGGLCLAGDVPVTRDHHLAELALTAARGSPAADDHALVLAAAAVEAALSSGDPNRQRSAANALALLVGAADADVALAAHAGLARLARHAGDAAAERAELTTCRDLALDALRPSWLASCERQLGAPAARELVPRPRAPVPPDAERAVEAPPAPPP